MTIQRLPPTHQLTLALIDERQVVVPLRLLLDRVTLYGDRVVCVVYAQPDGRAVGLDPSSGTHIELIDAETREVLLRASSWLEAIAWLDRSGCPVCSACGDGFAEAVEDNGGQCPACGTDCRPDSWRIT